MRQNSKWTIFSTAFLLIALVSCKPRKAIEFREAIVQKERSAFRILLGKNSTQEKKLLCLTKNDYKGALALVDQQEKEFNSLIKEIETLPADDIKQGKELKTAALDYYVALKELHLHDRVEISNLESTLTLKDEELRAAQHRIVELSRQKQNMYDKVYEKEKVLHDATEKFNSVNGI